MPRYLVAHQNDLQDGDLRQVKAGDTELVLVRARGHVHAYPAHCPHAGGPLAEGLLNGDRLMCPWHHACFSAHTGDLLEPPAQDALVRFDVVTQGDDLYVNLPDDFPESRVPDMTPPDPADERVFAILGAGAAGSAAAEALRQAGFAGRVLLISEDAAPPYDRTVLSKEYLGEPSDPALRGKNFYDANGLELHLNRTVLRVDPAEQALTFADGEALRYDALLLATGSKPVPLDVPGTRLGGVFYLRTLSDAERLAESAGDGGRAVVVGGSFIGLECAASLRKKGLDVTVVMPGERPFAKPLGPEVGEMFRAFHEEQSVTFVTGTKVAAFGGDERIVSVTLENGQTLPADLVVVGTGVQPALPELVGVALEEDGGVSVDGTLKLRGEHGPVYAVGDLAHFPDPHSGSSSGESVRVEHWRVALQHGRAAARALLGETEPFSGVPFFWTKQYGVSFRYIGHAPGWDECVIDGDLGERTFLAYYLKENRVVAVFGVGRDPELCAAEEALRLAVTPTAAEVRGGPVAWAARLGAI